ncbi:hypothetical protein DRN86_02150 [Candidatus Geothermarchaeota archaeon]|nr:MAG: hypothetical protein DRN86_02150 [Candidatus Geothermarchaeota archaeon]
MVTYDDVKNAINSLKRDVLKYLYAETINRRYNIFNNALNRIQNAMNQITPNISVAVQELAFGLMLERYLTSKANQIGLKGVEFSYADETVDMTGLDGNTYDNPVFPQIQLTTDELNELTNAMKEVPANLRKGICVIRIKAEDKTNMPRDPDEEDSLFAYYFADSVNPLEHHAVDYGAEIFGQDITIPQFFYQTVDTLFMNVVYLKLEKVEAESLVLGWFWNESASRYDVLIGVDIKPMLTLSDPDNPDNKRKTTAMFVLNVYNALNVNGGIMVDKFEVPLKANKHYLVIIGAELTGLRGIEIPIELSYP